MQRRIKGNRVRQQVIKYLEERGFEVGIVERTGRFIFPKDLWSLFDIAAIDSTGLLLIQVATNKPHTHKKFVEFCSKYPHMDSDVYQFVWKDRKGFTIYQYGINYYNEVKDICPEE